MDPETSFGAWIRRRRKVLDLTQEGLAQRVSCSTATIRKLEMDERRPSRQLAERLAESLEISLGERAAFVALARVEQRVRQAIAPVGETLKHVPRRPTNLPGQLTSLIGREQEVAKLRRAILRDDVRLITLTGAPGIGKTRLSIRVASDLLEEWSDGVFFVALAPISNPDLVAGAVAQALGVQIAGKQLPQVSLVAALRDKQMLLLLDNFEQVMPAAQLVVDLLTACPGIKVIVTSREALHVRGEQQFVVPPLALPDMRHFSEVAQPVSTLAHYPAVALFVDRVRAVRPDFIITAENAQAVAEICARLDGLPLAIELVAARTKLLAPQALLARLDRRLALLTHGPHDLPPRHRTLRAAIDGSYELLEPWEQALFGRLAVFVGGCTLDAAEAVCEGQESPMSILDGLTVLMDKSLALRQEQGGGDSRFMMLETIREYALERLSDRGEVEALRRRHAYYYLGLGEAAEPYLSGTEQRLWLNRLHQDHDNLRAALRWALEHGEAEIAARLSGAIWRFWWVHGHLGEGRRWLEGALAAAEKEGGRGAEGTGDESITNSSAPLSPAVRAKALNGAGVLAGRQGDFTQAVTLLEASLALQRQLEDTSGIATVLNSLGNIAIEQCDYARATALHEESLALKRKLGDSFGIASSLNNLGMVALDRGDLDHARALFEESLILKREIGDRRAIGIALNNLGMVALEQGDLERAQAMYEEGIALFRDLGDKWGIAMSLNNLGMVALKRGDLERAFALLVDSLALKWELGDKENIAWTLDGLAEVAAAQRQPVRAARLLGAVEALRQSIGAPLPPAGRPEHERYVAAARAALDEAAFAAACQQGRLMSLAQVIAYASADGTSRQAGT